MALAARLAEEVRKRGIHTVSKESGASNVAVACYAAGFPGQRGTHALIEAYLGKLGEVGAGT